jgi:hypothetical protein
MKTRICLVLLLALPLTLRRKGRTVTITWAGASVILGGVWVATRAGH